LKFLPVIYLGFYCCYITAATKPHQAMTVKSQLFRCCCGCCCESVDEIEMLSL